MSRTSLLRRLSGAKAPTAPAGLTVIELQRRLDQTASAVAELTAQAAALALDTESGDATASGKIAGVEYDLAEARTRLTRLTAATTAARVREADNEALAKAAIRQSRRLARDKHLELAVSAAEKIDQGISLLADGRTGLLRHLGGAQAASDGLVVGAPDAVDVAVNAEIARRIGRSDGPSTSQTVAEWVSEIRVVSQKADAK